MGNLAVHTDWHRVASYHNFRVDGRSHCLRPAPATLSAPARNLYSRHHLARTLEYHCNPIYIFKSCKTSRSDGSFEHNPANHQMEKTLTPPWVEPVNPSSDTDQSLS